MSNNSKISVNLSPLEHKLYFGFYEKEVLRDIGKDYASQKEFFDELMVDSKTLIFNLSSIFIIYLFACLAISKKEFISI